MTLSHIQEHLLPHQQFVGDVRSYVLRDIAHVLRAEMETKPSDRNGTNTKTETPANANDNSNANGNGANVDANSSNSFGNANATASVSDMFSQNGCVWTERSYLWMEVRFVVCLQEKLELKLTRVHDKTRKNRIKRRRDDDNAWLAGLKTNLAASLAAVRAFLA